MAPATEKGKTTTAAGEKDQGHSSLGASSCERWWNCPGSVAKHAAAPKPPESEYAAEGHAAHDLLERLTKGKLNKASLTALIGTKVKTDGGFNIPVTAEMIDAVLLHFDTVVADYEELKKAGKPAPIQIFIEQHVVASSISPDIRGTADTAMAQKGNLLRVYDFKYGQGQVVEVVGNKQGLHYVICTIDFLKCEAFDKVEIVIIQPRAPHAEGPVRRWVVPMEVVRAWREELKRKIAATQQSDAPIVAGKWCRWCNAKVDCPAMRGLVQRETALDFAAADTKIVQTLVDPDTMTPELMAKALSFEEVIGKWFEAIRERVQARLERGEEVPGWKLVNGRSNRQWKSEDAVVAAFGDIMGDGLYQPRKLRSPADLEVVVGKKQVAELVFKPEPKKTIAPLSDARPATVQSTAAADFKHLEGPASSAPEKGATEDILGV